MAHRPASHQPRANRNDGLVSDAVVETLCELGWPGLTLRNVAQRAGVARQTVTDRYPTRTAMAVAAWQRVFSGELRRSLDTLMSAHGLMPGANGVRVADAWRAVSVPTRELTGALDLLLQSPYEPELKAAVEATLGPEVSGWTRHNGRSRTRRLASQRAYLLARALGLLALGSIHDLGEVEFEPAERAISAALSQPARVNRISSDGPPRASLDTGDPRHDALLTAVIEHVARNGYEGTSVDAVCADAGVTKGFLFKRYASKQALFVDAARRRQRAAIASSGAWLNDLSARQGRARAEATFVRSVLQPSRFVGQRISGEELRLAMRDPALAEEFEQIARQICVSAFGAVTPKGMGYAYSARAVGEGIGLLTLIDPDAWQLPFEVVLVPLQDAFTRAYLGTD